MDDSHNRPSGLPRLSRLPVTRPTPTASSLPRPTATNPRPTSIRPSPSREGLHGRTSAAGGELQNPKLRSSSSQSQLRSSSSQSQLRSSVNNAAPAGETRTSRLRASASREQLQASAARTPAKPKAQPPVSMTKHSRVPSTPHRRTSSIPESTAAGDVGTPRDPVPETQGQADPQAPETDEFLFKRRLTLTRRPSEVLAEPPFPEAATDPHGTTDERAAPIPTEDASTVETVPSRTIRPRPSLSERTMETLARIPSSPALRKKSSAFFEPPQPRTRAESNSRPGSSYNSDGSARPASRPGSSAEQDGASIAGFRASTNTSNPPLDTISGTPRRTSSGVQAAKTPKARATPGRNSLTASAKASTSARPSLSAGRSPSPDKKPQGGPPSTATPKTVATRPSKSQASVNGLFKKPSLPAVGRSPAKDSDASRQTSVNSVESSTDSWDGTIPSIASTDTSISPEPVTPSARKSSAALREQIAKAKAAKRAAAKQAPVPQSPPPSNEAPIVPSDDGFDFGVGHEDPFNSRKGENPHKKVLNQRVGAARTSGKLNIAALRLKEMPAEVMKMYDLESVGGSGNWAESVDLTRLIAADNEFETLGDAMFPDSNPESFDTEDEDQVHLFAGLETADLHGNLLVSVPVGFRRLANLTSINLSSNRLSNDSLDTIAQMTSLRDLKLANNLLFGPLSASMANLDALEILDLHGNNVSALPTNVENMGRLRILNLNENSFESLSFNGLAKLPLTELTARKNKLSGTLIEEPVESLPQLQTLDVSMNQLARLVPLGGAINLPVLHALSLSMNRLQGLPDMTSWTSLLTLTVDENSISGIPNSFTSLDKLRHADFSSNDIRVVPPEVARMDNLSMIRLSGNPLRDKKFASVTTDELKEILASRLEPPPPYQEPGDQSTITDLMSQVADLDAKKAKALGAAANAERRDEDSRSDIDDDFATPPTSAPHSPSRPRSHTASSRRSRSQTLSNQTWPVKSGGILDRSRTESSSLHPVICSKVAADHQVKQVHLSYNLFSNLPNSLSFFAATLTSLSLANNQLVGESYLEEEIELPALRELNLSSNRITGLGPLTKYLIAPELEKTDVSLNRISAIAPGLREVFPKMNILLASNNHLMELEPEAIVGLRIVEAANNDITHLNPRIGLLGGQGGLQRLEVMGNRFRVPRWNVLERGTEATLRWLRGRVPVAEMAAWKKDNGDNSSEELD